MDVLSFIVKDLLGFAPSKVIGVGTMLDNCRLKHAIAQEIDDLSTSTIHSLVIGESGPTSGEILYLFSSSKLNYVDFSKNHTLLGIYLGNSSLVLNLPPEFLIKIKS